MIKNKPLFIYLLLLSRYLQNAYKIIIFNNNMTICYGKDKTYTEKKNFNAEMGIQRASVSFVNQNQPVGIVEGSITSYADGNLKVKCHSDSFGQLVNEDQTEEVLGLVFNSH